MSTSSRFVAKNGLDNNSKTIVNVANPVNAQDAVTKNYVDTQSVSTSSGYPSVRPTLNLDFTNSTQIDPRIAFTRSTTGTYYDGKTTSLAEQNLLTYSQDFTNAAWIKSNSAAVIGATAPDGTATSNTITTTVPSGYVNQSTTIPLGTGSTSFVYSVYLKAGTVTTCRVYLYSLTGGANCYVDADLSAGTIGSPLGSWTNTPTITNVGNGWYRVAIVNTPNSSTNSGNAAVVVYNLNTTGTYQIWGAQLEQRSSLTAYTPTTTSRITNYIPTLMTAPINTPRIDYDPITRKCKGLLIEEPRTNLLTYSQDFSNAIWLSNWSILSSLSTIAPNGSNTAFQLTEDLTTNQHSFQQYYSGYTSGIVYTHSIYAKSNTRNILNITLASTVYGSFIYASFNLTLGTVISSMGVTTNIYPVGNGWYRCSVTASAITTATGQVTFKVQKIGTSNDDTYLGDGTSGIYIWGAQLEQGTFSTSYIPTTTVAVTRGGESANISGTNFSNFYNENEGTYCLNFRTLNSGNVPQSNLILTHDGSGSKILMYIAAQTVASYDGVTIIADSIVATNVDIKATSSYANSTRTLCANGDSPSSTSSTILAYKQATSLSIYQQGSAWIKQLRYYDKSLTTTELQAITS